ncbi:hypothetical protein F5X99DRAFT_394691 [Biscogniauxia marginata]|nr:hypothetical protein F5X99DRAFT_394691 [Biscogniauxia marginata]
MKSFIDITHLLIDTCSGRLPKGWLSKGWLYEEISVMKRERGINGISKETQRSRVIASTGNLLGLIPGPDWKDNTLWDRPTLAHQTVREFVRDYDFQRCILGRGLDRMQGNGHTFLAKYYLGTKMLWKADDALYKHEITTGTSLTDFIDSIPKRVFGRLGLTGPLQLAVRANLRLYFEEKLRRFPNLLRDTQEELLQLEPHLDPPKLRDQDRATMRQTHLSLIRFLH